MELEVASRINSVLNSVSYRIGNTLIDPGDEWEGFQDVNIVLLTHAHFDHIYGINRVIELNPEVRIYTNDYGKEMLMDSKKNLSRYHQLPFVIKKDAIIRIVENNESIELENHILAKAIFTPGHNPSCITWIIGDCLFTGDSYIPGIKTVTNLPGGNKIQALCSEKLIGQLASGFKILSGHPQIN